MTLKALLKPLAKKPPKGAMIDANRPRHTACHCTGNTKISLLGNCKILGEIYQGFKSIQNYFYFYFYQVKECITAHVLKLDRQGVTHWGIHSGRVKYSGLNKGPGSQWSQPVDKSCVISKDRCGVQFLNNIKVMFVTQ